MALYDVVKPCMVGKLHYARPTTQPVEVDDATAAPLAKAGFLSKVDDEVDAAPTSSVGDGAKFAEAGQHAGEEFAKGVSAATKVAPARGRRHTAD